VASERALLTPQCLNRAPCTHAVARDRTYVVLALRCELHRCRLRRQPRGLYYYLELGTSNAGIRRRHVIGQRGDIRNSIRDNLEFTSQLGVFLSAREGDESIKYYIDHFYLPDMERRACYVKCEVKNGPGEVSCSSFIRSPMPCKRVTIFTTARRLDISHELERTAVGRSHSLNSWLDTSM